MELARIEKLLAAYFEGNTSLEEEKSLRKYFTSDTVAPQLKEYQPIFEGFHSAQHEVSQRELIIPDNSEFKRKAWWYGIAASAIVAIVIGSFVFSGPSMSYEEREALLAFNKSKEA